MLEKRIKTVCKYIFFQLQIEENKYKMMKLNGNPRQNIKIQISKRLSSATLTSKKLKNILTNRPPINQMNKNNCIQINTHNIVKPQVKDSKNYNNNINEQKRISQVNVSKAKLLAQLLKPIKYEKTVEQTLLLKNSDKSKLIYWNNQVILNGNEKYLILSSDFLLDQDCFWQKKPSQQSSYNIRARQSTQYPLSTTSITQNPLKKSNNPLLNWSNINLLVKQWKKLHIKNQTNNHFVIWIVKRQQSYSRIIEFAQMYGLRVDAVYYVKRKRANYFVDFNPIIKEVYQRHFNAVIGNNHQKVQKTNIQSGKLIRFKQKLQNHINNSNDQIKKFNSITNKNIKVSSFNNQNDQNLPNKGNIISNKNFSISKVKKPSQIINFVSKQQTPNKLHPISATRIRKNIDKRVSYNFIADFKDKQRLQPLITQDQQDIQQQSILSQQNQQKKFKQPQIYYLEVVKCNKKDFCDAQTYQGKIPLIFDYHSTNFINLCQKVKQNDQNLKNKINMNQAQSNMKICYFNMQKIQDSIMQTINKAICSLANSNQQTQKLYKLNRLCQITLTKYLQIFTQQTPIPPHPTLYHSQSLTTIQLNQQQQQQLQVKAQQSIQLSKKKMIDNVISVKGRNYMFQNSQSIHYFVGDYFKRNYQFLYKEVYQRMQIEFKQQKQNKNKNKQHQHKPNQQNKQITYHVQNVKNVQYNYYQYSSN